jgi:hypothetical protein
MLLQGAASAAECAAELLRLARPDGWRAEPAAAAAAAAASPTSLVLQQQQQQRRQRRRRPLESHKYALWLLESGRLWVPRRLAAGAYHTLLVAGGGQGERGQAALFACGA